MNFMKLKPLFNRQLINATTKLTRSASSSPSTNGISFQITDEQQSLLELADKFSKEEIVPKAAHHDSKFF